MVRLSGDRCQLLAKVHVKVARAKRRDPNGPRPSYVCIAPINHSPLSDSDREGGFPSEMATGWLGSDGCCCSDLESWLSTAKGRGLLCEVQAISPAQVLYLFASQLSFHLEEF